MLNLESRKLIPSGSIEGSSGKKQTFMKQLCEPGIFSLCYCQHTTLRKMTLFHYLQLRKQGLRLNNLPKVTQLELLEHR